MQKNLHFLCILKMIKKASPQRPQLLLELKDLDLDHICL